MNNANQAFEFLTDQLNQKIEENQEAIASTAKEGDFGGVQRLAESAADIQKHLETLEDLQERWNDLVGAEEIPPVKTASGKRRVRSRLAAGVKTMDKEFRIPILKALVKNGGSGTTRQILDIVEADIGDSFREVDYDILADGRSIRWRNTAQWERYNMVVDGLLKSDSKRGTWEILEKGRAVLRNYEE